jgi:hypothetical protein
MCKNDHVVSSNKRWQYSAREDEGTMIQGPLQKATRRTRHSFYLDVATVRSLDQAYKQINHELYPGEISKSAFLEECIRYALVSLTEIKCNLSQHR